MISSSPDRDTFQIKAAVSRAEEGETSTENAEEMIEFYKTLIQRRREQEQDPEWQKDNMEYDMRSTPWFVDRVRASEVYAQNLYAAMCNRDFQKNEVWPQLKNQTWSASWRSAGGIVADLRGEGDYMDWYCSGILNEWSDEEFQNATKADQERYLYLKNNFVGEGHVTDEIRKDLFKLGWIVLDDGFDE